MKLDRIDWPTVLFDLQRSGMNRTRVAQALGVHRATVQFWLNYNGEPRFQYGEALVRLWCKEIGKGTDELPRLSVVTLSVSAAKR